MLLFLNHPYFHHNVQYLDVYKSTTKFSVLKQYSFQVGKLNV